MGQREIAVTPPTHYNSIIHHIQAITIEKNTIEKIKIKISSSYQAIQFFFNTPDGIRK